jgi:flavin-dependent dehydrogenase
MSLNKKIRRIVIVGGGSAGWLTAGILAAEHKTGSPGGLQITLVESPDVNPIGVGEGTWPSMRDTLRDMGVSETDFMRECDASFKQASRFERWVTGREGDVYYHPFALPVGYGEVNLASQWRSLQASKPFAEVVSHQSQLCEQGKAPKQKTTPEWAAVANYAYHLDAGKFGQFLQKFCTGKLGVAHVRDHVRGVNTADNGDIASLETAAHGQLEGDLFIDCTGFASLLLGQHFGIPFVSANETLFCDTALALQVPYEIEDSPIASNTISTAQSAGWIWDIGLPTRRGVGHVYSSSHTTQEDAELALRKYVENSGNGGRAESGVLRKISINPGHREKFWHRNCVAVGISAGFIEPLEASALALIEMSAAMIRDELPATREIMDVVAGRFNDRFRYRWDRIIDFLKLHYVLSQRTDSEFWLDNRRPETIPERLQELMGLWRYRSPSRRDFYEVEEIFPAASYQYVLYGMEFQPEKQRPRYSDNAELAARLFAENYRTTERFLTGLPLNRELINHVRMHGMLDI